MQDRRDGWEGTAQNYQEAGEPVHPSWPSQRDEQGIVGGPAPLTPAHP